jgi:hypothetical protein
MRLLQQLDEIEYSSWTKRGGSKWNWRSDIENKRAGVVTADGCDIVACRRVDADDADDCDDVVVAPA